MAEAPSSCAQAGSSAERIVEPAPYGYWSKERSTSALALVEELEQRIDERLVGEGLQVRDVQRRARAAGDVDELADRLEHAVALVADVRDERRAERRRLLGQRDELVGVRVRARQIDHPEGERARARLEARAGLAPHRRELVRGRRSLRAAHHEVAHRVVPGRRARGSSPAAFPRASRGTRRRSTTAIPSGPVPSSPRRYACRSTTPLALDGSGREAVRVDQLGREALRDLRLEQRVDVRVQCRVGVHVDEPGAEHHALGRRSPRLRGPVEGGLHGRDPRRRRRPRRPVGGPSPGKTSAPRMIRSKSTAGLYHASPGPDDIWPDGPDG